MILTASKKGAFVPEGNAESNGEIIGRCNALHDWLMSETGTSYFSSDEQMVCILMGFTDVLEEYQNKENEKAAAATATQSEGTSALQISI